MKTLFVTIHHKRSLLFEEGIKLLIKDFPLLIQSTGFDNGFGEFGVSGVEVVGQGDHTNYDTGLARFKDYLAERDWDVVHFLDNDLFIRDTTYIKQTLVDFEKYNFGFAAHVENTNHYDMSKYPVSGTIAEVPDSREYRWENAAMIFRRDVWDSLTKEDLITTPTYIKVLNDKGVKMGSKKVEERLQYTHAADGWIHIGNLFPFYYGLEELDMSKLDPESKIHQSRIGYFIYQKKRFGITYGGEIEKNLGYILQGMNEQRCLDAWLELTKGYYE